MEEELIKILKEVKEFKEQYLIDTTKDNLLEHAAFQNLRTTQKIVKNMEDNNISLEEAFNGEIRTYEDALAKCLEAGATANDEFMHDFTSHYTYNVLGISANLFALEDFTKDKDNLDFLRTKVKECLKYIDRL